MYKTLFLMAYAYRIHRIKYNITIINQTMNTKIIVTDLYLHTYTN